MYVGALDVDHVLLTHAQIFLRLRLLARVMSAYHSHLMEQQERELELSFFSP
jgi:hypothetical protein